MTGAAVSNAPVGPCSALAERVTALDWQRITADLDMHMAAQWWARCFPQQSVRP